MHDMRPSVNPAEFGFRVASGIHDEMEANLVWLRKLTAHASHQFHRSSLFPRALYFQISLIYIQFIGLCQICRYVEEF